MQVVFTPSLFSDATFLLLLFFLLVRSVLFSLVFFLPCSRLLLLSLKTVDSSAVRSISQFKSNCSKNKITVLCGGANSRTELLLQKSGLFSTTGGDQSRPAKLFTSVSSCLEHAEEAFIARQHGDDHGTDRATRCEIGKLVNAADDKHGLYKILSRLLGKEEKECGEELHDYYSVVKLKVDKPLFWEFGGDGEEEEEDDRQGFWGRGGKKGGRKGGERRGGGGEGGQSPGGYAPSSDRSDSFYIVLDGEILHKKREVMKDTHTTRGGVVGYVDFFASRHRTFTAVAGSQEGGTEGATVARFNRGDVERMSEEKPELYAMLERYLLRVSVLELCNVNDI